LLPESLFFSAARLEIFVWFSFFFIRSTRKKMQEVCRLTEENLTGIEPERQQRNLDRITELTLQLGALKVK